MGERRGFVGAWPWRCTRRARGVLLALALALLARASLASGPPVGLPVLSPVDREALRLELPRTDPGPLVLEPSAQDEPGPLRRVGVDLVALVRAPADFDRRDWGRVAAAVAAVGAVSLFDDDVREEIHQEKAGSAGFAEKVRPLGQEGGLALMALAWSWGRIGHRPALAAIGQDGIEASVLAAGIVAPAIKQLVGRARPRTGRGSRSFSGGESFPSGETTEAFALASVIAAHSESRTVDTLAYATAALIGWQRIRLDAHWASDVAAGAILGTTIGRFVVRRNHPEAFGTPRRFELAPLLGDKSWGLQLRWSF